MTKKIIIENRENSDARYEIYHDSGDWWQDENGDLHILLCNVGDPVDDDEAFLLALHELIEAKLCIKHEVEEADVVNFDIMYDSQGYDGQPGDHINSPYRREHRKAALIEHLMANFLGHTGYGRVE